MTASRTAAFLSVVILAAGAPALAAADYADLFRQAQAAKARDDFAAAERLAGQALAERPDSTEALFLLGQMRAFRDDFVGARSALARARALVPADLDIRLMYARVLGWSGESAAASAEVDFILAADPQNAEAREMKSRLAAAPAERPAPPPAYLWRIDVGGSRSAFSVLDRKDWREGAVRVQRKIGAGAAHGEVLSSNRFADTQTGFLLGGSYKFNERFDGYLEGGGAPGGTFLPRRVIGGGGSVKLPTEAWTGTTLVTLDARQKHYTTGNVEGIEPGLQQYLFGGRVWLTGKWLNLIDARDKRSDGWLARADWQVLDALRIHGTVTIAPDSDNGTVADVHTVSAGAVVSLTPWLDLRADVTQEDRKNSYVRNIFAAGFSYRF